MLGTLRRQRFTTAHQFCREVVNENASLAEDLGADSLDTVEWVMELEEEFGDEGA
ncbi:MAG: acyl carrier protein [Planctomycetales bacterium]|nr:acyl carrier protein [Planctomycetales bacterium]